MASLLRQIVASPRVRHAEAGLDLCYVTENIIATSGPSSTYPQVAYRNPLKDLVSFLDAKHGAEWAIWEFRAEGTGYPDSEVYNRVWHYPWPDHHPPPFALLPLIIASMRNWLKGKDAAGKGRVVVVHCKAGKGRSGTASCSYLISEEGWTPEDALQRFTERRMKPGFGPGISIPSQKRTISYVDRWTRHGKNYVERRTEVVELHVWGLRDGVKIAVEGYVQEGKVIQKFHVFSSAERQVVRGNVKERSGLSDVAKELLVKKEDQTELKPDENLVPVASLEKDVDNNSSSTTSAGGHANGDVVFKPTSPIVLPSSDVNIDIERRNKTKFGAFTMVTSVAHVWFNTFFEGNGPEQDGKADDSGVFELEWDALDGIKGSSRKGTRAFDKMAVVWRALPIEGMPGIQVNEPGEHEEVEQAQPADWRKANDESADSGKALGLRAATTDSAPISRAESLHSIPSPTDTPTLDERAQVKASIPKDDGGG